MCEGRAASVVLIHLPKTLDQSFTPPDGGTFCSSPAWGIRSWPITKMVYLSGRELRNTTRNFLIMPTVKTDFNTELLDQELTVLELRLISGGLDVLEPTTPEEEEELREMEAWWLKRSGL